MIFVTTSSFAGATGSLSLGNIPEISFVIHGNLTAAYEPST